MQSIYISSETSPNLSRRPERASVGKGESPRKGKQLEVPKHMSLNLDPASKAESSTGMALAVPASKTNIVAPWEGSEWTSAICT